MGKLNFQSINVRSQFQTVFFHFIQFHDQSSYLSKLKKLCANFPLQNVPYITKYYCKQINLLVTRGFIYWFVWLVTVCRILVGFVTTIWFLVVIHFVTPIWFFVVIITAAIFLVLRWFVAILVLGRWIGIFLVILILKQILNKLQH